MGDRPLCGALIETTRYYSSRMCALSPEEAAAGRMIFRHETPGGYCIKVTFGSEFGSYVVASAPFVIENA